MFFFSSIFGALAVAILQGFVAANNFGGMNSFFLHAYQPSDRLKVLDAIKAAEGKVLRIFISSTPKIFKGTGSIYMPDIEPVEVGFYDDMQLLAIDRLMVEARDRVDCAAGEPASSNNVAWWYKDPSPVWDSDLRRKHIVNHRNTLLGNKKWSELASHSYAFNIQKEGQGHLNRNIPPVPNWWCDRAKQMRNEMGKGSTVPLISTGGGNEFPNSDVDENWNCAEIDLVGIHSYYGVGEFSIKLSGVLSKVIGKGKLIVVEEFGGRLANKVNEIQDHINVFNSLQIPWAVWQINKPGMGTNDHEFWTDEESYKVVKNGMQVANELEGSQNFPNLPVDSVDVHMSQSGDSQEVI